MNPTGTSVAPAAGEPGLNLEVLDAVQQRVLWLTTSIVHHAKSVGEIAREGMYGVTAITPVINPPQAAILGVGAARETLARDAGEIVDRSLLTPTLSCNHRILYGADAARFLADIKALLEAPLRLGFG